MTDVVLFYIVLLAFYLATCIVVIRRRTVVFVSPFGTQWQLQQASGHFCVRNGVVHGLNPLFPWQHALISEDAPVIFHAEGIICRDSQQCVWFDGDPKFSLNDRVLLVNDQVFVTFRNHDAAKDAAVLIRRLLDAEKSQRADIVRQYYDSLSKTSGVLRKLRLAIAATRCLRWVGLALGLYMYILAPVIYLHRPQPLVLLVILLAIIGSHCLVICPLYVITHARVWPANKSERWMHAVQLILYPPGALRLAESIMMPMGFSRHPWVWACLLTSGDAKRKYLSKVWRDYSYPSIRESTREAVARLIREHCADERKRLEACLNKRQESAFLHETRPPEETLYAKAALYCPRCLGVYIAKTSKCADCHGVPLRPIERHKED